MVDLFWHKLRAYLSPCETMKEIYYYLKQDEQLEDIVGLSQRTLGHMPVQH